MRLIPKIIHCVWVGGSPKPPLVLSCIESWRRMCPGWEIREWGDDFAKTVDNRYVREAYARGKWAFVSDWIRLYALERFGGFYLDTDMEMRKPFDGFLGERFVISWERMNGRTNFNCGVIGCERGSPVVRGLLRLYDGIPFVKDNEEFDEMPNTERFVAYFRDVFNLLPGDGTETVRFGDGCVVFPWTHFLPADGYTFHHYAASWLDAWLRKVWFRLGPFKIVRLKRRKEASPDAKIELHDGEHAILSLPLGARKRVVILVTGRHPKKTYDNVYSLGSMCRCADYLRMSGLRLASGPFDWIYNGRSFENVLAWCINEFKGFIDKDDMVKDDPVSGPKKTVWYRNAKTGFRFPHEFVYGREFNEMYAEVRAKYDRRIARFMAALRSGARVLLCYIAREQAIDDEGAGTAFAKLRGKYGDHVDAICFAGDLAEDSAPRIVEPVPGLRIVHFHSNGAEIGDRRIIKDEEAVALAELSRVRVPGGMLSNKIMAFRRWAWRSKISRSGNKTFRLLGIPVWRIKIVPQHSQGRTR